MRKTYTEKTLNLAKNLRKNMTIFEQELWEHLRAKRFLGYKFKRQVPIGNYIVDFLCTDNKHIIELDGSGHLEKNQINYDKIRDEYLAKKGYKIIRIFNNEMNTIENILEYLRIKFEEQ